MALTGIIPSQPPQPVNQTFDYGERGQIEYRPNWGQPIVNGQWRGEQPQTPEQQLATANPREILQKAFDTDTKQLQDQLSQAEELLTGKTKNELRLLQEEHNLKLEQLQRKYSASVPAEKQQEYQQRFQTELDGLNTNFEIAQRRLVGKIEPDLNALRAQGQQAIQEAQQKYRDKMTRLDTIDELEKNGTIVDPIQAKREKLQVAGVMLDVSQMRVPQTDPYRELQRTDTILRGIQQQLDQGIKYNFETGTIEGQLSDDDREQLTQMKNELTRYRLTYLLPTVMPQYANVYQGGAKLTNAAERARGKVPVISATGQPVSTLAQQVEQAKTQTKTLPNRAGLRPNEQPMQKPRYQKNPATGQTRVSFDGGKTWQLQ